MPSDERSLPGGDDGDSLLPDVLHTMPMHPEDTLLVVATMDGVVHAVEGASGALLWSFDSGGKLLSSSSLDRLQQQADAAAGSAPTATDWQFGEAAQDADGERPAWDAATERDMARGKGETRHLPLPLPLPHGPPPSPEAGGPHVPRAVLHLHRPPVDRAQPQDDQLGGPVGAVGIEPALPCRDAPLRPALRRVVHWD